MKTLLSVTTALALVGAVSLQPAMAQASKPSGLASGTLKTQEGFGPIRIARDPRRFGCRPQRVSARRLAVADRVLQRSNGALHHTGSRGRPQCGASRRRRPTSRSRIQC